MATLLLVQLAIAAIGVGVLAVAASFARDGGDGGDGGDADTPGSQPSVLASLARRAGAATTATAGPGTSQQPGPVPQRLRRGAAGAAAAVGDALVRLGDRLVQLGRDAGGWAELAMSTLRSLMADVGHSVRAGAAAVRRWRTDAGPALRARYDRGRATAGHAVRGVRGSAVTTASVATGGVSGAYRVGRAGIEARLDAAQAHYARFEESRLGSRARARQRGAERSAARRLARASRTPRVGPRLRAAAAPAAGGPAPEASAASGVIDLRSEDGSQRGPAGTREVPRHRA